VGKKGKSRKKAKVNKNEILKSWKLNKVTLISVCLIGIFLVSYITIRAHKLSFTHDESLSFSIVYGHPKWADTSNNHIFNTLMMGTCSSIFGNSEISLRFPNLLSGVI
jgi:hypothetical protein